jgi:hypothetical protein
MDISPGRGLRDDAEGRRKRSHEQITGISKGKQGSPRLNPTTSCRARPRSFPSTPVISRAMPSDDLLDQFLAEPSSQRPRVQKEAVIDRAKDRIV